MPKQVASLSRKQHDMERGLRHRRLGSVLHEEASLLEKKVKVIEGSILGVSGQEKVIRSSSGFERDIGGQLKHYGVKKLFRLGWLTSFRGSILDNRTIQALFLVYCVAATLISLILCPGCTGDQKCSSCYHGVSAAEGNKFSAVVSFLLAFFNGVTLSRWWDTRSRVGDVMSHSEDFALTVSVSFPEDDPRSQFVREELVRYVNLSHALMYKAARGMMDPTDLLACGLLTQEEWQLLQKVESKYLAVHYWMADLLTRSVNSWQRTASRGGGDGGTKLSPGAVAEMFKSLRWQRENASSVMMHLSTQIPYPYVHLLVIIVRLHMMYTTMTAATNIATARQLGQIASIGNAYVMLLVSTLVFEGLLQLHAMLYNPFSFYTCDLPCHSFADELYRNTHTILHGEHHLPHTVDVLDQLLAAGGGGSGGGYGSDESDVDLNDLSFLPQGMEAEEEGAFPLPGSVADLIRDSQRTALQQRLSSLQSAAHVMSSRAGTNVNSKLKRMWTSAAGAAGTRHGVAGRRQDRVAEVAELEIERARQAALLQQQRDTEQKRGEHTRSAEAPEAVAAEAVAVAAAATGVEENDDQEQQQHHQQSTTHHHTVATAAASTKPAAARKSKRRQQRHQSQRRRHHASHSTGSTAAPAAASHHTAAAHGSRHTHHGGGGGGGGGGGAPKQQQGGGGERAVAAAGGDDLHELEREVLHDSPLSNA